MYWPAGVQLVQQALLMAFWLSLPLLASISAAGLAGGLLQGTFGHNDPAALVAVKLLAGGIALLFFGAWMVSFTAEYWTGMWLAAVELAR
jgi:flagellar biosynthesis protein FliQ